MSVYDLTGRKALVTGGARGLGAGMAEALARAGAAVVIGDILTEAGQATADELKKSGATAGFVQLDVTNDASWELAVADTIKELGGLDILVNNAGLEITSLIVDLDPDDIRKMLEVNVLGTSLGLKHAFRAMRPGGPAGRGGAVVNIASVAATIAFPGIAVYSATKSAIDRLTRVAAMESGKLGYAVRVNCIYPGLVPTDMGNQLAQDVVDVRAVLQRRGSRRRRGGPDPAGPPGRGRGHGRRRGLPRLRREPLHYRRGPARRRRHGHVSERKPA